MPRCSTMVRCGEPIFTMSIGSTGNSKKNYTNKVKWTNSLTLYLKINWEKESSGERNSVSPWPRVTTK
jgi:hypothetical protein